MSGKLKRLCAILAALGITVSGTIEFLQHLQVAFPGNHKLGAFCATAGTILGLIAAYHPISIKDPGQPQGLQPPAGK